jgi:hypothetical protein
VTKELWCGRFIYGESKCLLIIYDSKDISGLIIESQSIHDLSSIVFDQIRSLL